MTPFPHDGSEFDDLVYADWLEDYGRHAEADALREEIDELFQLSEWSYVDRYDRRIVGGAGGDSGVGGNGFGGGGVGSGGVCGVSGVGGVGGYDGVSGGSDGGP